MRWRLVGPFRGGRTLTATGVPGQPNLFYFGAVGGGVWRSENAGRTWEPIFDSQPIASIGAIAVAPSDPNVIYVGSGEADMRSDISYGNGMYKSVDAGKTWTRIGLTDTRQIGRILVDARDPNLVFVAALGHGYGPNKERGVFRSKDGGKTWTAVLFKDENTGAIDLAIDPSNNRTILAALWQTRRPPWNVYPPSNGPGSGLYRSEDGGDTWKQVARRAVFPPRSSAASASRSRPPIRAASTRIADAKEGGLYVSQDKGVSWKRASSDKRIWERGWYFAGVTVDPQNADIVYACSIALYRSTDGGKTFLPFKGAPGGDDYHRLWIDPADSRRMIVASDQGAVVTVDGGRTWSSWYNQPTGQFYHLATDDQFPYWIYGSQQDSGAAATPSRTDYRSIMERDWKAIAVGRGERLDRAGSAGSQHPLGRKGRALRPADSPGAGRGSHARVPRPLPVRVDAAARDLAARPEGDLFRESVSLQDGRRRPALGKDEPRPDAREPRRAGQPRPRDRRGLRREGPAPRGHLRDRAFAARRIRRAHLVRHGRRPDLALARRREELEERHAEGPHGLVEGRDHRGFALRRRDGLRRDRPAPARRPDRFHPSHAGRRKDLVGDRPRDSETAASSTSCARIRSAAACSTRAPRPASSSRSTTGTTGSRSR